MLYYALVFFIIGLIAGALGMFGIAAAAGQIARCAEPARSRRARLS